MIVYIRCSKCHHAEKAEGRAFSQPICPKCGGNRFDIKVGGEPPAWWREDRTALERNP